MKKQVLSLVFLLAAGILSAGSVWTGNAAVGGSGDFSGTSDYPRAASNSFPAGTLLEVTNPRGGASIVVEVTERLDTPGVFILVEVNAAEVIGLPTDQVQPVRVSPLDADRMAGVADASMEADPVTSDTDYNPAATLGDDDLEPRTVPAPVVAAKEPEPEESDEPEPIPDAPAIPEPPPPTTPAEPVSEPEPDELPGSPETILTYDLAEDEDQAASVEPPTPTPPAPAPVPAPTPTPALPEPPEEPEEEGGDTIYFLSPSDLRPPPAPETIVDSGEDAAPDKLVKKDEAPMAVTTRLTDVGPGSTGAYIQIGAYRNRAVLEETAGKISALAPGYPLAVRTETIGGSAIHKLLIGPLRPAERGVVLSTARSTIFPDAFPYDP